MRAVAFFLSLAATLASGAGLLISGIATYAGWSAFLCGMCLIGTGFSLVAAGHSAGIRARKRKLPPANGQRYLASNTPGRSDDVNYVYYVDPGLGAFIDLPAGVRKLEQQVNAGNLTTGAARARYRALLAEYKKYHQLPHHHCGGVLYQDFTYCPVHGELEFKMYNVLGTPRWTVSPAYKPAGTPFKIPPAEQVRELSAKYGLPVETPLQKSEPLPRAIATAVSGARELDAPEEEDEGEHLVPTLEESLDGYVPDGSDDLRRELKLLLSRQSAEARKTPFTAGRKRQWQVSPEWAAELCTLKNKEGEQLWHGPGRFLYGYPVRVSAEYGIPELVAR